MITALRIQRLKCFADLQLELGPLTVLTGLNSSGKTTVLQALMLLRQSHLLGTLGTQGLALRGPLVNLGDGTDALLDGADDETIEIAVTWDCDVHHGWSFCYLATASVLPSVGDPSETPVDRQPFAADCQYLVADRIAPQASYELADDAVRRGWLGTRGEYTAHLLAVRGGAAGRRRVEPGQAKTLLLQTEAWLQCVSPGVRLEAAENRSLDVARLTFAFPTPEGYRLGHRPTNVGFGLTACLPVVVAALSTGPGGLLLVESPEAHLHPRGQFRLGQLLARAAAAGAQVIVETHSDHVLNGIRLAAVEAMIPAEQVRIHYFDAAGDPVSPRLDPSGGIDPWPEGFFDEWDNALLGLLRGGR